MGQSITALFPEGSSLTARQALTALGEKGYRVDICDPNPYCICRFSKFTNKVYKCPPLGIDPAGYYRFISRLIRKNHYDVLLPIHEQAFLFSKKSSALLKDVHLAISQFSGFEVLQSKLEFARLLERLDIPQPAPQFVKTEGELKKIAFPYYAKCPYGTAGKGTWLIDHANKRTEVTAFLQSKGYLNGDSELLVQEAVRGVLCVIQSLFNHGELVGAHSYRLCSEGVGGSASAKIGVDHPAVKDYLKKVGKTLHWHGCLMLDYIYDEASASPFFIEANPRLGETMNATLSGFNIAENLIKLSIGELPAVSIKTRPGVKTHSLIAILLGMASKGANRRRLIQEGFKAIFKRGKYRHSREVLTNVKDDWLSFIPLVFTIFQLLLKPGSAIGLASHAIDAYAISDNAVAQIRKMTDA